MKTQNAAVILTGGVLASIVAVAIFVPGENTSELVTTITTIAAPVLGIFLMLMRMEKMGADVQDVTHTVTDVAAKVVEVGGQVNENHKTMNSRLDELNKATAAAAHAKGMEEGFRRALAVAVEEQLAAERNRLLGREEEQQAESGRQAVEAGRAEGHAAGKVEEQIEEEARQTERGSS